MWQDYQCILTLNNITAVKFHVRFITPTQSYRVQTNACNQFYLSVKATARGHAIGQ